MFYRISTDDDPTRNVVRLETWWDASPRWAAGKYVSRAGQIEILDPAYKFPIDYRFSHDDPGVPRSPMIDAAFNRPGADKQKVKEEIYGSAVKDSRKLLQPNVIRLMEKTVRRPLWQGDYTNDEWVEAENGPIQLWVLPHNLNGVYVMGADPSLGTSMGAKAGLAAFDVKTGLCVLSARFQDLDAIGLAQKAVSLCKIMAGPRGSGFAKLNWESTGINTAFSSEVVRLRYPAVWFEPGKSSPGCHNSDRGEAWLLELGRSIAEKEGIIVSGDCLSDLKAFEYDRKFDLIFASQDGHGDLAIATALAWRAAKDKRRAVLQAGKASQVKFQNEINDHNREQKRKPWSSKFDTSKKPRGKAWRLT